MFRLFIMGMIFPLVLLVSCGDEEVGSAEGLTMLLQEKAFILPGNGDSCAAIASLGTEEAFYDDVPEYRVGLSQVVLNWSRTAQDLHLVYIKVDIDHANTGEYKTVIDGLELDLLLGTFNGAAGAATWTGSTITPLELKSNNTTFVDGSSGKPSCSLAFGTIPIPEDTPFFSTTAKITFVGIARGNGKPQSQISPDETPVGPFDEEAVKITQSVRLEFDF